MRFLYITANDGGVIPPVDQKLNDSEKSYVRQCLDVIMTLLRVYGFDSNGYSMKGNYDHWIRQAEIHGSPMGYVKWKIASYYAFHQGSRFELQELPPSPCMTTDTVSCLVGGKAYKWLIAMKSREPKRFESFLTSVLYSKKGMPRPDKKLVDENVKKSFKTLTTPPPPPKVASASLLSWIDIEDLPSDVEPILSQRTAEEQIRRTVREVLKGAKMEDEDWLKPFFPSTKANYDTARSGAGTLGQIMSDPTLLQGLKSKDSLVKITEIKSGNRRVPVRGDLVSAGGAGDPSVMVGTVSYGAVRTVVDRSELFRRWMVLYDRILVRARNEVPATSLVGLPEALKVRVISKGPAWHYFALRPLQQKLWKSLRKLKCFRLIGEKVSAELVQEQLGAKLGPNQRFLSVDYSDATNQMYSWCSNAAIEEICACLGISGALKQIFYESMTEHIIDDPEKKGQCRPQANGQLMGSIVSFPILCIVNAAICRWMLEIDSLRKIPLRDVMLAINGDDAVMKCTPAGKLIWERIGSFFGLKPSVGKVYFSSKFLNLNSTTYNYSADGFSTNKITVLNKAGEFETHTKTLHYELVQYVNLGLLLGLRRSGGQLSMVNDEGEWGSLGAQARQLVSDSPVDLRESVLCQFISSNERALKQFSLPWFLPEYLCGVGLPSVGKYKPENFDLQVARKILSHPDKFPVPAARLDVPYKVWELVNKRVKFSSASVFNTELGEGVLSQNDILGVMCIDSLFTADLSDLVDLDQISSDKATADRAHIKSMTRLTNAMRRTSRIWNRARRDQTIPLGSPLERIPQRPSSYADVPFAFEETRSRLLTGVAGP